MKRKYYLKPAKRISTYYFLSILIAALLIIACTEKQISDETAVRVYVENMMVEEKYSYNQEFVQIQKQKNYEKYKTSADKFAKYLENLKHDNERWREFFKRAEDYLTQLKNNPNFN